MFALERILTITILVGAIAIIVWMGVRARRRTEAFRTLAREMGCKFAPEVDVSRLRRRGSVPLFDYGESERARNVLISRTAGDKVRVFDYQYTTGFGKTRQTQRQTVVLFPGSVRAMPDFTLLPESLMVRIVQAVGYQDVDFESNPEFSRRYVLRGPDEAAIRSAFDAGVLAFFAERTGWNVEVRAGNLIVYRAGRLSAPENLHTFVGEATAVLHVLRRGEIGVPG